MADVAQERSRERHGATIGFDPRYLLAFVVVLLVETAIALLLKGGFVRGNVGDVLVVVLIYCLVKTFVRTETTLLPWFVLAFAVVVEVLQGFDLVERLGLGDVTAARVVLGTTFDVSDIASYAVGCAALAFVELVVRRRRARSHRLGPRSTAPQAPAAPGSHPR